MFATLFLGTLGVVMGLFVLYQFVIVINALRAERAARMPVVDPVPAVVLPTTVTP